MDGTTTCSESVQCLSCSGSKFQTRALAASMATLGSEKMNYIPLTRTLVGRPGLDPGTLGIRQDHPTASVSVQITWLEEFKIPPTSTEILSNLIPWLHHWLHSI